MTRDGDSELKGTKSRFQRVAAISWWARPGAGRARMGAQAPWGSESQDGYLVLAWLGVRLIQVALWKWRALSAKWGLWIEEQGRAVSHGFRCNPCFPFGNYMWIVGGLKGPSCRPLSPQATSRPHQMASGHSISSVVSSLVTKDGKVRSLGKRCPFR